MSFLPYGRQTIEDNDIEAVVAVLKSDWLTTGPAVELFEQRLAEKTNALHAVAVSSGTAALHVAYHALGLRPGDIAIVPAMTFLATANAAQYCGANVIFSDVDPGTGLMEADHAREALSRIPEGKKARLLAPVHLNGQGCDMRALKKLADQHGLKIVEDACHTIGAKMDDGSAVGACTQSDATVFSFHPVKTITMGEGGAITCRDQELVQKMRRFRSHNMDSQPKQPRNQKLGLTQDGEPNPWYYEMSEPGYNYRASDLNCALGASQLTKLERFVGKRRALVALYRQMLEPFAPHVKPVPEKESWDPAWHLFPVHIDFEACGIDRASLMNTLKAKNIGTQVHYIPVPWQPYYQAHCSAHDYPGASAYYERVLSLPLHIGMEESDVKHVVDMLGGALRN